MPIAIQLKLVQSQKTIKSLKQKFLLCLKYDTSPKRALNNPATKYFPLRPEYSVKKCLSQLPLLLSSILLDFKSWWVSIRRNRRINYENCEGFLPGDLKREGNFSLGLIIETLRFANRNLKYYTSKKLGGYII